MPASMICIHTPHSACICMPRPAYQLHIIQLPARACADLCHVFQVGTSLCLPDEPEPTKGRILVLHYDDGKVGTAQAAAAPKSLWLHIHWVLLRGV